MHKPSGYTKGGHKLLKSIYGLKQASRQWCSKFSTSLIEFAFEQFKADYSLFIILERDSFLALLVYIDDIIISSNSQVSIDSVKPFQNYKFKITDLGCLHYFFSWKLLDPLKVFIYVIKILL